MHKPSVAFGNLYQACLKHGIAVRINTWDGGQWLRANWIETGVELFRWESDWGEGDVASIAAEWLMDNGYIQPADLEG